MALKAPLASSAVWLCAGLLALAAGLRAVQLIPATVEELTARADLVLHGRVASKSAQRDPAGRLFTRVQLEVFAAWKGVVSRSRFPLVLAGGTLGDQRVVVTGQADYQPGEEVVVFLQLNPRGEGVTLGLAQGKFEVWQDSVSGRKYVRNLFWGRPGAPAEVGAPRAKADAAARPLSLEQLRRAVQGGR